MVEMTRDRVLGAVLALVLVVVVAVVGYAVWQANHGETLPPPILPSKSADSASPTTDATQAARDKAIAAYNGYWESYVAASAKGDAMSTDLARYVADPLLTQVRVAVQQSASQGIGYKGRPTWSPRVTAIDLVGSQPSASIEDCFDSAAWQAFYTKTGKSAVAPGQATRYVITSTVKLYDIKGWLITDSKADRSRTC